jgi:hypothetical protein
MKYNHELFYIFSANGTFRLQFYFMILFQVDKIIYYSARQHGTTFAVKIP